MIHLFPGYNVFRVFSLSVPRFIFSPLFLSLPPSCSLPLSLFFFFLSPSPLARSHRHPCTPAWRRNFSCHAYSSRPLINSYRAFVHFTTSVCDDARAKGVYSSCIRDRVSSLAYQMKPGFCPRLVCVRSGLLNCELIRQLSCNFSEEGMNTFVIMYPGQDITIVR